MADSIAWAAVAATVAIVLAYECFLALAWRKTPERSVRHLHARLRQEWLVAVSRQAGSEVLAVQTLRNALMSAIMSASTAVLGLMGAATAAAQLSGTARHPTNAFTLGSAGPGGHGTLALVVLAALCALLFASMVSSAMAVRYFNHASFVVAMPVGSPERLAWTAAGGLYVRRAGVLYSWGLRQLMLVAPLLAALLSPTLGPVAALALVASLAYFDRAGSLTAADAPQTTTA